MKAHQPFDTAGQYHSVPTLSSSDLNHERGSAPSSSGRTLSQIRPGTPIQCVNYRSTGQTFLADRDIYALHPDVAEKPLKNKHHTSCSPHGVDQRPLSPRLSECYSWEVESEDNDQVEFEYSNHCANIMEEANEETYFEDVTHPTSNSEGLNLGFYRPNFHISKDENSDFLWRPFWRS